MHLNVMTQGVGIQVKQDIDIERESIHKYCCKIFDHIVSLEIIYWKKHVSSCGVAQPKHTLLIQELSVYCK